MLSHPGPSGRIIVREGDTITSIAARVLGDPALWVPIADLNGIRDPRMVTPGQTILLPALR